MPVNLPAKDYIIAKNAEIIKNSSDPNEIKCDAGKFFNDGEGKLDNALEPYVAYENVLAAAYGLASKIADDHVFCNGNKRTATATILRLLELNGYVATDMETLKFLINSLVTDQKSDPIDCEEFTTKLSNIIKVSNN